MSFGSKAIEASERAYRRLLRAYPRSHRDEYGEPMAQLFGDLCRDAWDRRGAVGLLAVWAFALRDAAGSLIVEHDAQRRKIMDKVRMALTSKTFGEKFARNAATGFLGVCAQGVLLGSVLKLTSLPLTEGQLMIGLLCTLAVSLQLVILGILVAPARPTQS